MPISHSPFHYLFSTKSKVRKKFPYTIIPEKTKGLVKNTTYYSVFRERARHNTSTLKIESQYCMCIPPP